MNIEIKVVENSATTVYVSHPTSSYGIFCYTDTGDLFVNSDWGFYGFAWRHIGNSTFKEFLAQTNAEYIVGKFEINHREVSRKKMPAHRIKNLTVLVQEFINHLKTTPCVTQ